MFNTCKYHAHVIIIEIENGYEFEQKYDRKLDNQNHNIKEKKSQLPPRS